MHKSYIFAFLTILCWSTVASAFKIALQYVTPVQLLFYSSCVSVFIFLILIFVTNKTQQLTSLTFKQVLSSSFYGFLNPFLYYLILFKAYSLLPAQIAQPLNFTWPIILVLLSIPFLKQPITFRILVALLISFVGALLITSLGKWIHFSSVNKTGIVLCFVSALIWATSWLLNIKDKRDDLIKLLLNFIFALFYLSIYLIINHVPLKIPIQGLLACIYVGSFEMGITFYFWLLALRNSVSTDRVSNLVYITPFISMIFIHYVLGEKIFLTSVSGLILIVISIFIQQKISLLSIKQIWNKMK